MPLAVTLFSALDTLRPGSCASVYIIDGGISDEKRVRMERALNKPPINLNIQWVLPDPKLVRGLPKPMEEYLTVAAYYRLLAPYLIPEAKAIYLDSDMVIQSDLHELWARDLQGRALAAVVNVGDLKLGSESVDIDCEKQGLNPNDSYFNSGVLIMDLEKWRRHGLVEKILDNIRKYEGIYKYADQDGLNAVLHDDWIELERRWNVQLNHTGFKAEPIAAEKASVIHYTLRYKPWLWMAFGAERRHYERFYKSLRRSGWFTPVEYAGFRAQHALTVARTLPGRVASRRRQR